MLNKSLPHFHACTLSPGQFNTPTPCPHPHKILTLLQRKLYDHFYHSAPAQRLLRGGRAAERAAEAAATAAGAKEGGGGGVGGVGGAGVACTLPLTTHTHSHTHTHPTGGQAGARGPELSVLAAITAVKKLCCHPDLVSAPLA